MKEVKTPNAFRLVSTQAVDVNLKASVLNSDKITSVFEFHFDHKVCLLKRQDNNPRPGDDKIFIVEMDLKLKNEDSTFILNVLYHVLFECENPITEEFTKSHLIRINAPAISFPFLRSFITTLTSNAGFHPIILPSINFTRIEAPAIITGEHIDHIFPRGKPQ
jgi:preprotein translocase subunit SecB